jgi:hypothetical protein
MLSTSRVRERELISFVRTELDAGRLNMSCDEPVPSTDNWRNVIHAVLDRALAWFARHGVSVERITTDDGNACRSNDFRIACASASVRHMWTRPCRPRAHGEAERFLQTAMREGAYAPAFRSSQERAAALPRGLHVDNVPPPHPARAGRPV